MTNRRWRAFCRRSFCGLCGSGQHNLRLPLWTLVTAFVFCVSGCAFLSHHRDDESSGDLTRGQQPLTTTTRTQLEEVQQIVQRARGLYAKGRLKKAQKVLAAALQADPVPLDALELESRISLDLGDREAYQATLKQMLVLHPESADVQNRIGKRLVDNGQWDDGVAALSRAYELSPQTVGYACDLAAACLEQSDNSTVVEVLTQAMRWNPDNATIPVALARYFESAANWQEAVRYYDVALQSDAQNPSYLRQKARCYYRLGEFANACDLYSVCIESSTSSVALSEYAEYGDACLRIGDVQRAQMVYDRISRYSPVRSRDVELLRVVCAIRRGDRQHARRILRDALVLWPNDEDVREMRDNVESAADDRDSVDSP